MKLLYAKQNIFEKVFYIYLQKIIVWGITEENYFCILGLTKKENFYVKYDY